MGGEAPKKSPPLLERGGQVWEETPQEAGLHRRASKQTGAKLTSREQNPRQDAALGAKAAASAEFARKKGNPAQALGEPLQTRPDQSSVIAPVGAF